MKSVVLFVAVFMVACQANPLDGREKRQADIGGGYAGSRSCVGPDCKIIHCGGDPADNALCRRIFSHHIGRRFGYLDDENNHEYHRRNLISDRDGYSHETHKENFDICIGGLCHREKRSAFNGDFDGGSRRYFDAGAHRHGNGNRHAHPRRFLDLYRTRRSAEPCLSGYCGSMSMGYGYQPMYPQMPGSLVMTGMQMPMFRRSQG